MRQPWIVPRERSVSARSATTPPGDDVCSQPLPDISLPEGVTHVMTVMENGTLEILDEDTLLNPLRSVREQLRLAKAKACNARGPKGDPGRNGIDGKDGSDGSNGRDGIRGASGRC